MVQVVIYLALSASVGGICHETSSLFHHSDLIWFTRFLWCFTDWAEELLCQPSSQFVLLQHLNLGWRFGTSKIDLNIPADTFYYWTFSLWYTGDSVFQVGHLFVLFFYCFWLQPARWMLAEKRLDNNCSLVIAKCWKTSLLVGRYFKSQWTITENMAFSLWLSVKKMHFPIIISVKRKTCLTLRTQKTIFFVIYNHYLAQFPGNMIFDG